jgi:serine/threonine-protein kinase
MVVGTQVGAYRVLQQIGAGGMGTVWLAEHTMLGRRAAIKLLHPEFSQRPDIVSRFFNEARAATAIADPGIVQIFDFGHHVDGTAYIAMEMLEGEALDRRLRRVGRLALPDALRIMRQVSSTLGVAHVRGIVHRDLKPENIFLVHDPEVFGGERAKVLDFGIAKLTGDPSVKTHTSAVMGTPAYMSPEQCRGAGQVDQRSDVYALGCMLFALLTGMPPFDAEGVGEIIAMHLREPAPLLSSRLPGIPPELDQLVAHCLAKDPAHRYASGTELGQAIGGLLGAVSQPQVVTHSGSIPMRRAGAISVTTLSSANGAASASHAPPRKSSRGLVIGGAVVVAIGAGIAVLVVRGNAPAEPPVVARTPIVTPPPHPEPAPIPAPPPPPVAPDPATEVGKPMKQLLASFVEWSHRHADQPCPDAAALGAPVNDPWGHALALTCTDQPGNQIAGAISAGPDGTLGTADDLSSWQLGREVTELVRGPRWVATAKPVTPVKPTSRPSKPTTRPKPPDDDIPSER